MNSNFTGRARMTVAGILASACVFAGSASGSGNASGLVVLNSAEAGALTVSGNASIRVPAMVVYVNSSSDAAVKTVGSATIDTSALYVVGGTSFNGQSGCTGSVIKGAPPFYSPMAGVAAPSVEGMKAFDTVDLSGSAPIELEPGYYRQGLKVSGNARVHFKPGVFVFAGSGLDVTSGEISGEGVCLVVESGRCRIAGASVLSLSPMPSEPMAGIVLFQPASNANEMHLAGGSEFSMSGTISASGAPLKMVGNSVVEGEGPQMGDLVVADRVSLAGTAMIRIGREGMRRISLQTMGVYD